MSLSAVIQSKRLGAILTSKFPFVLMYYSDVTKHARFHGKPMATMLTLVVFSLEMYNFDMTVHA